MEPNTTVEVAVKDIVYVGMTGHVLAIDKADGQILWKTKLKQGILTGNGFVNLLVDEARVFAHASGELYCLDADTGEVLWSNPLQGLGYELASLATQARASAPVAEQARLQSQQHQGAAT